MSLKKVISRMSVQIIPGDAILHGILQLMEGREAFNHTDDSLNERMFTGSIFEDLGGELAEELKMFPSNPTNKGSKKKIVDQLDELAELIDADYVLITNYKI